MCEFCTFEPGRMFNIYYQGGIGDFDKLDISMGYPNFTRVRNGIVRSSRRINKCPRCLQKLKEADDGND